jgi:hypothetical protein
MQGVLQRTQNTRNSESKILSPHCPFRCIAEHRRCGDLAIDQFLCCQHRQLRKITPALGYKQRLDGWVVIRCTYGKQQRIRRRIVRAVTKTFTDSAVFDINKTPKRLIC